MKHLANASNFGIYYMLGIKIKTFFMRPTIFFFIASTFLITCVNAIYAQKIGLNSSDYLVLSTNQEVQLVQELRSGFSTTFKILEPDLKRRKRIIWTFYGSGGFLLISSLGFRLCSDKIYNNKYIGFTNRNRMADFNKANWENKVAVSSLYAGVGALITGIIISLRKPSNGPGIGGHLQPLIYVDSQTQSTQLGLVYNF